MKRILSTIAALAIALAGCHAPGQVPPATSHTVALSCTPPNPTKDANGNILWAGCGTGPGQSPCVFSFWRCTGNAATCGVSTLSTNVWQEITTPATRPSACAFNDPNASGTTANYIAETVQGTANSSASNIAVVQVPGVPTAPALNTPTVADLVKPALPSPLAPRPAYQLASITSRPASPLIVARVIR